VCDVCVCERVCVIVCVCVYVRERKIQREIYNEKIEILYCYTIVSVIGEHTHTHKHTHTYTHTHTHTHTHTYIYIYIYMHAYKAHTHTHTLCQPGYEKLLTPQLILAFRLNRNESPVKKIHSL